MYPHAHHFVYSLPPEGAPAFLGNGPAEGQVHMYPHAQHFVYSLPPAGAQALLGNGPAEGP